MFKMNITTKLSALQLPGIIERRSRIYFMSTTKKVTELKPSLNVTDQVCPVGMMFGSALPPHKHFNPHLTLT